MIAERYPKHYITYYRSLKSIISDNPTSPEELKDTCGFWYWGRTGTGKSKAARDDFPGAYWKLPNKWWDGYKGEDVAIIDDVDDSHQELGYFLKIWTDLYPFRGEIKCGSIFIRPKTIVVTSNCHPSEIWSKANILEPIYRRMQIHHFQRLFEDDRAYLDVLGKYVHRDGYCGGSAVEMTVRIEPLFNRPSS